MSAPIQLSRKKATKNPNVRWEGLNEFLAFADVGSLPPVQRTAALAYGYSSHVQMGGHRDYFSTVSHSDCPEVVAALRAIGATGQADVLTAALAAVDAASSRAPGEYSNRFAAGVEFADLTEFDDAFECCTRSVREPPSAGMLQTAKAWLDQWHSQYPKIVEYVRRQLRDWSDESNLPIPEKLEVESINILWTDKPSTSMIYFHHPGDDIRAWHVTFDGFEPQGFAYDD